MEKITDDDHPTRRVGARVRPDDVTVHVMGEELTLGVERAARLIGVGHSTMYTAVKRGDFETIRLNGRTVLLTLPLLERIGVAVDATARLAPAEQRWRYVGPIGQALRRLWKSEARKRLTCGVERRLRDLNPRERQALNGISNPAP